METKQHEDYLFKIARRVLQWNESHYKEEELADLVMQELLDLPLPQPSNPFMQIDVHDEEFLVPFAQMLEKFVNEYDDMAQMETIRLARELLDSINS